MTARSVDDLVATLAASARVDDGEPVPLLDHMLQCAALLAVAEPDDVELQAAGLVHDLGWVLGADAAHHARAGAAAVEPVLGPRVAALVAGHDQAKRWLVSADPHYRGRLSEVSVATLALQGGAMDAAERARFESGEHFEALVALRRADDAAKVPGRATPTLDSWRPHLDRLVTTPT